jgi:ureidoacrylate peracid hydrolase
LAIELADPRYEEDKWTSSQHKIRVGIIPKVSLIPHKTALLIVDMQKAYCVPEVDGAGVLKRLKEILPEDFEYYVKRLKTVVANLQKLQRFFRDNCLEVVYCVVSSLTADGRDRDTSMGIHFPPYSPDAQVVDQLKPQGDELCLSKTTSSLFAFSNAHHVLVQMGIEYLVIGGMATDGCVQATATGAKDLFGPRKIAVVEDSCAAFSEEDHIGSIRQISSYGVITSTNRVIQHLKEQLQR